MWMNPAKSRTMAPTIAAPLWPLAFKRRVEESRLDPDGFAAKANRRNNAETGNRAFKAILGDQIYCKSARAQRNELLCMAIAYNLTRLVFLEVERGIQVSFKDGTARLAAARWASLEEFHRTSQAATRRPPTSPSPPPGQGGDPGQAQSV